MDEIRPIRILHVVGAMNRAGTETMLMNIYRNIDHDKIQFDFISYSKEESHYDQEIKRLGGKIIKLNRTSSVKEIYKVIKKYGPYDAVHAHTLFHCGIANFAAFLAGVKIRISHAHTTLDRSDQLIKKLYISSMRNVINRFSTHLLSCSKQAGIYLFGEKGIHQPNYFYFPNVINYFDLLNKPQKEVSQFKLQEGLGNSLIIGHIGRFIEAKNHPFLLEIMKSIVKKNNAIKLLLVGDGDFRQKIERDAKQAGIYDNIRFVGIREDIPTMLHSMDVFVFPSIYEGLGLVLLEAQASGVPCIVSEAIQPEADLNIGLVSKLSLADGADAWGEKIIKRAGQKEKNLNKILESFEKNGYSLNSGITKLLNIYQNSHGGSYEKCINHLL